jgi:hypothetical protein
VDTRDTIAQTLENMVRIYQDVGDVMRLIEEKIKLKPGGPRPLGYSDVTWEVSRALDQPKWWLYRHFGRAYISDHRPEMAIGFCIHLGQYTGDQDAEGAQLPLVFPFMNVARLKLATRAKDSSRPQVLDGLWAAGWNRDFRPELPLRNPRFVSGVFPADWKPVLSATGFFVDLLALTDTRAVEQLVVNPMLQLLEGREAWGSDAPPGVWTLEYGKV